MYISINSPWLTLLQRYVMVDWWIKLLYHQDSKIGFDPDADVNNVIYNISKLFLIVLNIEKLPQLATYRSTAKK